MAKSNLLFAAGLVVGGLLVFAFRPAPQVPEDDYIVIENEYGHWIYKKEDPGLRPVHQETSPAGLQAIWELQGDYQPTTMDIGGEPVLHFPMTRYSTDSGSFQVVHRFYRIVDGKLVEIELEDAPRPPK